MTKNSKIEELTFINRKEEKKYFLDYLENISKNILFVYGPKSTGKTTLIKKIIQEELDPNKYAVSYLNMRERQILQFKDFKTVFFPESLKGKVRKIVGGIKINLGFFGWDVDDESLLKEDVFAVMTQKLEEAKKNGIKPVIILDEFQYLKNIYLDDKKEVSLIGELFKFFIALTKQNNVAHVICLTSDSYYLEELYSDTKLTNTSDFYLIRHLSEKDIYYWLEELEKCPEKMVDDIWKNLGGSVWEIWQVFAQYKNTGNYKPKLDDLLEVKYSLVADLYDVDEKNLSKSERKEFLNVIEKIVKKGYCLKSEIKISNELIKKLVSKDFWFYDLKFRKITANSESFRKAFKRLLKELKK